MRHAHGHFVGKEVRQKYRARMKSIFLPACLPPFVEQVNSLPLVLDGNVVKGSKEKREGRKRSCSEKEENQLEGGK